MKNILVTGGAGYIGSHTVVELINTGYTPIIVDNLCNSNINVLGRIEQITGTRPIFYELDINNQEMLSSIFIKHKIDAVMHFAALKAVGESVLLPLTYYQNNVAGSMKLLQQMLVHNVKTMIFSSSATVYGDPDIIPVGEDSPLQPTNPYGFTKLMTEQIMRDLLISNPHMNFALLRYFNPVGAHPSGLIGEDPNGSPNNLMPYVAQVAVGKREYLNIFGNDYKTHDGTGVRDYIHVVDLAIGHVRSLEYFAKPCARHLLIVNLGTGNGYSVLDVVKAFEKSSGKKIDYKIAPRRSGDVATCYANPSLARELLGFTTKFDLLQMCADTWHWQKKNPNGYN